MSTMLSNGTVTDLWHAQTARFSGEAYEVARDLVCLPLSLVNVYLYGPRGAPGGGWVLIDAGLSMSETVIIEAARERFGDSAPAAIILTHGHFDHVGALRGLLAHWNVPVFAHRLELPYLTGRSSYPPPDPAVGGGLMSFLCRLYPRGPIDVRPHVQELPEDGSVPGMPGWRWIHTPGHCTGHISLFLDGIRLLVAGDAFVTQAQESFVGVMTQAPKIRRPPAYYTTDWAAARRSIEELSRLRPAIAATGHGVPMTGEIVGEQIAQLLDHWETRVPNYGRYVRKPALADENGVRSVPPPVFDRNLITAVAVGAVAVGGLLMLRGNANHSADSSGEDPMNDNKKPQADESSAPKTGTVRDNRVPQPASDEPDPQPEETGKRRRRKQVKQKSEETNPDVPESV